MPSERKVNKFIKSLEGRNVEELRSLKARFKSKDADWKYYVCCRLVYNITHNEADGIDLAFCYMDGYGCQSNTEYALALYKDIANTDTQSAVIAQYQAGFIYYISKRKYDEAEEYFKLAEKSNYAPAICKLGDLYFWVKDDFHKAKEYYIKAAALGNDDAKSFLKVALQCSKEQLSYAKNHFSKGERIKGKSALNLAKGYAIISGATDTIVRVANVYYERKIISEAYSLYEATADLGNTEALDMVIKILLTDFDCGKDNLETLDKYLKLADEKKISEYADSIYKKGLSLEKNSNLNKAIEYYELSAETGYIPAQLELGLTYNFVSRVKNYKEAEKWYLMVADSSSDKYVNEIKKAQAYLAELYYNSKDGVDVDVEKAMHYALMAADSNAYAMRIVGWIYRYKKDYEKAFEYYTRAIENGSYAANADLGRLYYNGQGVEKNVDKATELYYEAALHEVSFAVDYLKGSESHLAPIYLGNLYLEGKCVEKNIQTALEYYAKVDSNDYLFVKDSLIKAEECIKKEKSGDEQKDLMLALAMLCVKNFKERLQEEGSEKLSKCAELIYKKGLSLKKTDINKTIEYYELAAEAGYAKAQSALGFMYYNGENGIKKDPGKALNYALKAKDSDPDAMALVGLFYYDKKDYEKALDYNSRAVEKGSIIAKTNLGNQYAHGRGVEQNLDKAAELYYEAAMFGRTIPFNNLKTTKSHLAPIYLGNLYLEGKCVEKNIQTALEYYAKVGSNDYELIRERVTKAEDHIMAEIINGKSVEDYTVSMLSLASIYIKNIDKDHNFLQAFKYLCNVAECDINNRDKAEARLEELCKTKLTIPVEVIRWLYESAVKGSRIIEEQLLVAIARSDNTFNNKPAINCLSRFYFDVKKDYKSAERWLKILSDNGDKDAYLKYAYSCYKNGDMDKAIAILETERSNGSLLAIKFLAEIYSNEMKKDIVGIVNDIEEILKRTNNSEEHNEWLTLWEKYKDYARLCSLVDNVNYVANEIKNNKSNLHSVIFRSNILDKLDAVNDISADTVYDLAIDAEYDEEYEKAILFYYVAAKKGSRKALYTIINMSNEGSTYFLKRDSINKYIKED